MPVVSTVLCAATTGAASSGSVPTMLGVRASVPARAVGMTADLPICLANPKACSNARAGSFDAPAIPELNASNIAAPLLDRVDSGPSLASENGKSRLSRERTDFAAS